MPVLAKLARPRRTIRSGQGVGRALVRADRWVGRRTHGRFVALGLRDLPSLLITTTGRKTGLPRTNPLLYAQDGDAFVVIGSNWGQTDHPAWSGNLIAHPDAVVTLRGEDIPVRARLTSGAEKERLRGLLEAIWPAYRLYVQRAAGRDIRIFRLERRHTDSAE
jgi:deazaflavin-dependent oxidoreductase (nitroreductase family)